MDNSYKAIIIDDELRARTLLSAMVKEYAPNIAVVAECEDLPNGVKAIKKHKPDLIFLDIEMPGHSGLELLDFFNEEEIDFKIIFTTAYSEYAIKAFKLSAIDYILKPIDAGELQLGIKKFEKSRTTLADLNVLRHNIQNSDSKRIALPIGSSVRFIDLDTVLYFKADSSYTELFFADETKLVASRTLKNFEDVLDKNFAFFRCHKSYIVNTNFITDYTKGDGGYLSMKNNISIPISSEKTSELFEKMKLVKRI
jgi:two-component system, LytTR family, response regulator